MEKAFSYMMLTTHLHLVHSPNNSSWLGDQLRKKHRDNLTLTFTFTFTLIFTFTFTFTLSESHQQLENLKGRD
jgi:hypothetical protein